jgi:regulator of replication initiation timing
LTAAQLERKRANDREAQRAIRQRTKDHIDSLERRIQELTATNDTSARLMQALQRNEELEQENAILRSRLNHAAAAMAESNSKRDPSQR